MGFEMIVKQLFHFSLFIISYVVLLFPAAVLALGRRAKEKVYEPPEEPHLPRVHLMIAAKNEQEHLAARLENVLELEYPRDRLRITVLANGCTDNTEEIARNYANRGVELLSLPDVGKTAAQNIGVASDSSDVVAFTDANVSFQKDTLLHLVAPFQDPGVGAVSGNHVYLKNDKATSATESLYWNTAETSLKSAESRLGGTLGAPGSVYAVRRALYVPLPADLISDFCEPLVIRARGHRVVFSPRAIATEEAESSFKLEYQRKQRIVQRSVYSLVRLRWLLNPSEHPNLSLFLVSHKVLRWLLPHFVIIALVSSMIRIVSGRPSFLERSYFLASTLAGFLVLLGRGLGAEKPVPVLSHAYYFYLQMRAAILGVYQGLTKKGLVTWVPTRKDG